MDGKYQEDTHEQEGGICPLPPRGDWPQETTDYYNEVNLVLYPHVLNSLSHTFQTKARLEGCNVIYDLIKLLQRELSPRDISRQIAIRQSISDARVKRDDVLAYLEKLNLAREQFSMQQMPRWTATL